MTDCETGSKTKYTKAPGARQESTKAPVPRYIF